MHNQLRPLVAEALGTFALVFVGAGSVIINQASNGGLGLVGVAFAHGLVLSVAVTVAMKISGGHINPAVSVALFIAGKINGRTLVLYIVSQLVGAIVAALGLKWLMPTAPAEIAAYGVPQLATTLTWLEGISIEAILTLLLVSAVFGTAVAEGAPKVGGFGIGLTLTFCILVGGPLTGAALNPARAIAPALIAGEWGHHDIYWIGPIVGGLIAAALWRYVLLSKEE